VLTQALSGTFAACVRLFTRYPLAVTRHRADQGLRSMVLTVSEAQPAGFFVLTQVADDLFVIRSWQRRDGIDYSIRPGEPAPGVIHRVIAGGMPVPRDGGMFGWVTDSQVTVLLMAHCRQPTTWDCPAPIPELRVMPLAGTSELAYWPPFTASPFDGRLWEYVERGQVVNVVPLLLDGAAGAYWVPAPDRRSARHEDGCVVVTDNVAGEEFWLPAGVYMDHWTLREGFAAPPVSCLLALPGVVNLTRRLR
jgi:hypothetical protein